jgi:hypothetical protein
MKTSNYRSQKCVFSNTWQYNDKSFRNFTVSKRNEQFYFKTCKHRSKTKASIFLKTKERKRS